MRFIRPHWPVLSRRLKKARRILLVFDFDGTLSPMVSRPARAVLGQGVKPILEKIHSLPSVRLVVLSGRPLLVLMKKVGIKGVIYGGVHGYEIKGPGLSFRHDKAWRMWSRLRYFQNRIQKTVGSIDGVGIEKKGFSVAVHYRNVRKGLLRRFRRAMRQLISQETPSEVLWKKGKKIYEAFPDVDWDKGKALLYLKRRLRPSLTMALGDDRTDEDIFSVLTSNDVGIRIGVSSKTQAQYRLTRQMAVRQFLEALICYLEPNSRSGFTRKRI